MTKNGYRSFRIGAGRLVLRILLSLVVAATVQPALFASETNTGCSVEYVDGKLIVESNNMPLGLLLAQIRDKTGVEFVLSQEQSEKPISIRLGPLPLAEGLEKVLNHFNHALLLGPSNEPVKVFILGYAPAGTGSPYPRGAGASVTSGVPGMPGEQATIAPSPIKTEETMPVSPTAATADIDKIPEKETVPKIPQQKSDPIPPSTAEMPVAPSSETMVIHPPTVDMVVTPSSETMVIRPAPGDQMVITPPTPETNTLIENMMKGVKDTSKPK
jgi:hypothetical protein